MSKALNQDKFVSIIIPTYNHAKYLSKAINSVLAQSYLNWEMIIVDNYSTDNTENIVKKIFDRRITYIKVNNNGVIALSRNAGIQIAKGEWIAFLDSDDWWTPDKLKVCMNLASESVGIIYHTMKIERKQASFFIRNSLNSWQLKKPVINDLLIRGNPIANSSVIIRSDLIKTIGKIDENVEMIAAEDFNTWLRVAEITDQFLYIPKKLGYYLLHNDDSICMCSIFM
ncbi:COG1216 Predicted glycosyltransferases [Candidatus Methylopumilus universalis]